MFVATLLSAALMLGAVTYAVEIPPPPAVETLAGTGNHGHRDGAWANAQFNLPTAIFSAGEGEIFVADTHNNLIRTLDTEGYAHVQAGTVLGPDALNFPRGGHRDGEALEARFNRPTGGIVDADGRIFIADSHNHAIRVQLVTNHNRLENQPVTTRNQLENVYTFTGGTAGFADGTLAAARFNLPTALALGPCGGIFVADTLNHAIRRIDPVAGTVTTIAGTPGTYGHADGPAAEAVFNAPMGITVSAEGAIFVADTQNHLIRIIEDGNVRTLAGQLLFPQDLWETPPDFDNEPLGGFADGTYAQFNLPMGLALWGDVLMAADSANHRIRALVPVEDGFITITLAGTGIPGHTDGSLYEAAFHFPRGVYVRENSLFVADTGNNLVRVISLENLVFDTEGGGY